MGNLLGGEEWEDFANQGLGSLSPVLSAVAGSCCLLHRSGKSWPGSPANPVLRPGAGGASGATSVDCWCVLLLLGPGLPSEMSRDSTLNGNRELEET